MLFERSLNDDWRAVGAATATATCGQYNNNFKQILNFKSAKILACIERNGTNSLVVSSICGNINFEIVILQLLATAIIQLGNYNYICQIMLLRSTFDSVFDYDK